MGKIGRNDPCPCGSGKKYKKCCLNKLKKNDFINQLQLSSEENFENTPKYRVMRAVHWSLEEVRAFSTEQIIQKLQDFGVDFREEQFLEDVKKFYSASDLADYWGEIYPVTAEGLDEDFIWMAAIVLWERLAPQVVNSEQIDDMMQRGYDLLEEEKVVEACTLWLKVWEFLKGRFSPDMKSIEDAEQVFSGTEFLLNWCQDLEMMLEKAGKEDISFFEKRIEYCREFCTYFSESDSLIIHNMRRDEAESYFAIGMLERGEMAFQALIEEFPNSAWGYIGWGDMYYLSRMNDKIPLDYEKAKRLYQMALTKNIDDKGAVLERLRELERERREND